MPPTGRIPPYSGGWHRDLFSGSVAEAVNPPALDTRNSLRHRQQFGNGTEVLATLIVRLAYVFTKAKVTNGYSHRLRDTFAVSSLEAGESLDSVSILLGHKSIKITERHYNPWVETLQYALDREILKFIWLC